MKALRVKSMLAVITITTAVLQVKGDFTVQVTLYSYNNPTQSCALCIGINGEDEAVPRCCDSGETTCIGMNTRCDTFYRYCLRPLGTTTASGCSGAIGSNINWNDAPIDFSNATVLGLSNPLSLRGSTHKWSGVQLFIEAIDRDAINYDDIVDRFFIDIFANITSIGIESARTSYTGVFGLAQMDLSFRVECAENFAGSECSECVPGYTGPFCIANIDDCAGIDCNRNGQCVDGVNSFSCNCDFDFTGQLCETSITDVCGGMNCSGHGQCMSKGNTFRCVCNPGFTGDVCDLHIMTIQDCDSLHLGIYVGGGIGVILLVLVILIGMATIVMVIKKRKISSDITTTTTQLYEASPYLEPTNIMLHTRYSKTSHENSSTMNGSANLHQNKVYSVQPQNGQTSAFQTDEDYESCSSSIIYETVI